MLELHITDTDISSGSVPITWCLDKELLQEVKGYKDPHIVISVLPEDSRFNFKENRYVVPLKDMMAYVSFRTPGKNKIYAYLEKEKPTDILDKLQSKFETTVVHDGEYARFIVGRTYMDEVPENYVDDNGVEQTRWAEKEVVVPAKPHALPLEVNVPAEYFAKEPAQWEKSWVLWLLKDKGIDQCSFRRRRIFAYTPFLQPLIMALNLLVRTIFTVLSLAFGTRGFSLKYLLHPLTYDLGDVSSSDSDGILSGGSIFIRPEPKKFADREPRTFFEMFHYVGARFWTLPFMPAILIPLVLFVAYGKFFVLLIIALTLFAVMCASFLALSGALKVIFNWLADRLSEVPLLGGENDIEDLICTGEPTRKPKKRSIKLRYLAIKAKVCKPFAG